MNINCNDIMIYLKNVYLYILIVYLGMYKEYQRCKNLLSNSEVKDLVKQQVYHVQPELMSDEGVL